MQISPTVYLEHCTDYETLQIHQFLDRCFSEQTTISWRNASIFIKPNLIAAIVSRPACTDPRFILAIAEWFVGNGCKVAVGDSPAIGKASSVLKALQIDVKLKKMGVAVKDLVRVRKMRLNCGIEVGIAVEPLDYDYFVNVPKVKAHSQMYVTLAVKNIFGVVKGMRKSILHMLHGGKDNSFSQIILDLLPLLPRNFSIIDGIVAMSEQGPLHGDALDLECLGFAEDPVALDNAIIAALQLDHEKSKLWLEAQRRGLRGANVNTLEFPLLTPDYFHPSLFKAPSELTPVRFNPVHFLKGNLKRLGSTIVGH